MDLFDMKETERVTTVTMTMTTGLKQHIKEIKVCKQNESENSELCAKER